MALAANNAMAPSVIGTAPHHGPATITASAVSAMYKPTPTGNSAPIKHQGDAFKNRERVLDVAKRGAVWIPVLLLAFIFIPQGLAKFSDTSGWAKAFRFWRYPDWFRVAIGVIELSAVGLLLWPRSAIVGATFIIVVMLGGMGTHIVKEGGRNITSEVVPLVLATIVLVIRRRA